MEIFKRLRYRAILNAVLTIVIGLMFIINPYGVTSSIAVVAGIIILCNGIFDIAGYISTSGYGYLMRGGLLSGILKCILGIFIFTHTDAMVALFSYIFSFFIILNGINCLESAMQLKRAGIGGWGVNAALSILVIAAGTGVLFFPIGAASTAAVGIGVILVADGVNELFTVYRMKKIGKEFYRSFRDMKDEIDGNIIDQ